MLPQPLTSRMDGVGEVLKTTPLLQGTTRSLKFLRPAFFLKIKPMEIQHIMARPPKSPAYLDELAQQQWKAKAKQLAERGDLTAADWNNLELYCVNYAIYRKAVADIFARGFSIANSQGSESRNPSISAKSEAERVMIKMSSLLGFDPVSRRRNPVETEEEDELDRME